MEKLTLKIVAIMLIVILSLALIPTNAFAVNDNIQIVKVNTDYIIYIDGMAEKDFKYATSEQEKKSDSIELNYIKSLKDDDGNNVALATENAKFLYIKDGKNSSVIKLDLSQAIDKNAIAEVEGTTNRIETEVLTINQRDEQIEQVKYEETVGGLEIADDQDATYSYVMEKLPAEEYSELKALADELNNEYEEKDMYSKIQFTKQFSSVYNSLITKANNNNTWKPVENMKVIQPTDTNKDDEYVVLLKQVKGQEVKYDAKLLVSDRSEIAPEEKTETTVTKRTTKLPITGESLILFAILAVIIIALIVVFMRMRKLKNND